jgi:putative tryptophan/tyrosine transport system substrate-binding protein
MRRRDFVTAICSAAALRPLMAAAQQPSRVRRLGVLTGGREDDPQGKVALLAFRQKLQEAGWTDGGNIRLDYRFWAGDRDLVRKQADELAGMKPDIFLAHGSTSVAELQRASRGTPIVFVEVGDPVGGGLVASLARPGGDTTGFIAFEFGLAGKWLELLKQVAPNVTRAAVLRDPDVFNTGGQQGAVAAVAPSLGVEAMPLDVRDAGALELSIAEFARRLNGGVIVLASFRSFLRRDVIIRLAAKHRLPAVYPSRPFVTDGGLVSYGADRVDGFRLAAGYVDRILKGEKPADLPVQAPTKYDTVLNLTTARALGLSIPETLLARVDEVIQ